MLHTHIQMHTRLMDREWGLLLYYRFLRRKSPVNSFLKELLILEWTKVLSADNEAQAIPLDLQEVTSCFVQTVEFFSLKKTVNCHQPAPLSSVVPTFPIYWLNKYEYNLEHYLHETCHLQMSNKTKMLTTVQ